MRELVKNVPGHDDYFMRQSTVVYEEGAGGRECVVG